MTETPNYWANLPANVRYSDKINPMERLLYAEITALSNYKGYCWASNKYFGKIFKKHPATWLNQGCWDDEFEQSNNDKMVY